MTTTTYDDVHRLTKIVHDFSSGANPEIAQFDYGYNFRSQRIYEDGDFYDRSGTQITSLGDGDLGDYYEYDLLGRLTTVYRGLATSGFSHPPDNTGGTEYNTLVEYEYDLIGNRTKRTVDGSTVTTYEYNAANEMTKVDTQEWEYDDNGNFHAQVGGMGAVTCCHYDYKNRVAEINVGSYTRKYRYDPFGRRIEKELPGFMGTSYFRYNYTGLNLLAYTDQTDATQKKFVYGLGLDDVVEYEDSGQNPPDRYYYHKNALGSTVSLTDRSIAEQVEQGRYEEFGTTNFVEIDSGGATSKAASQIENDFLYTGRQYDDESGRGDRYHMRARDYDPGWGRFRQRDPLGYVDGPDAYSYAKHSPAGATDRLGLAAQDEFKIMEIEGVGSFLVSSHDHFEIVAGDVDDLFPNTGGPYPDIVAGIEQIIADYPEESPIGQGARNAYRMGILVPGYWSGVGMRARQLGALGAVTDRASGTITVFPPALGGDDPVVGPYTPTFRPASGTPQTPGASGWSFCELLLYLMHEVIHSSMVQTGKDPFPLGPSASWDHGHVFGYAWYYVTKVRGCTGADFGDPWRSEIAEGLIASDFSLGLAFEIGAKLTPPDDQELWGDHTPGGGSGTPKTPLDSDGRRRSGGGWGPSPTPHPALPVGPLRPVPVASSRIPFHRPKPETRGVELRDFASVISRSDLSGVWRLAGTPGGKEY